MNQRFATLRRHALAASAAALPALAGAACHVDAIEMPVTLVGSRAVATVGIEGTQVPLTVDTGAFFSMITLAAAQQLKLEQGYLPFGMRVVGLTGNIEARMATVKKLQFMHGSVPDVDFIVGGNEPGAGTMGWLGRNLLTFTDLELDFAHGMVRFMFPNKECSEKRMAYWAGDQAVIELPLVRAERSDRSPEIEAVVEVNGQKVHAVIDSGAHSVLSLRAARRAGIAEADMTPTSEFYGLGEESRKAWTATVEKLDIGDESVQHSRMAVADFDGADLILGIDFLLSHRVYVSKKQRRIYLTYNGGPVFALNKITAESASAAASAPIEELAADDADGFARRGAARAARQDYAGALADLDRACALAPRVAGNFVRRADVHLALRQVPQAIADYDTALALEPGQAEARLARAGLYAYNRRGSEALADLRTLDHDLPAESNLRRGIADFYMTLDQPALALPQWAQWLAAHPHEAGREAVLNERCWTRLRLGVELAQALDDCDRAVDIAPKDAAFRDSRGWAYLRLGKWRDARSDFDRSLKLRPEGAWSLYGRGLANARLDQADASRADLEAARKLQPDIDAAVRKAGVAGELAPPAPVAVAAPAASGAAH